jgi:hypothetical protein
MDTRWNKEIEKRDLLIRKIWKEETFTIATYKCNPRKRKRRERECKLHVNIPFLGHLGPGETE